MTERMESGYKQVGDAEYWTKMEKKREEALKRWDAAVMRMETAAKHREKDLGITVNTAGHRNLNRPPNLQKMNPSRRPIPSHFTKPNKITVAGGGDSGRIQSYAVGL